MPKKQALGNNVTGLDGVLGTQKKTAAPEEPAKPKKARFTCQMDPGVLDRARDCAYWEAGVTLAGLVEQALASEIDRREKKNKEPYKKRPGKLQPGRPVA